MRTFHGVFVKCNVVVVTTPHRQTHRLHSSNPINPIRPASTNSIANFGHVPAASQSQREFPSFRYAATASHSSSCVVRMLCATCSALDDWHRIHHRAVCISHRNSGMSHVQQAPGWWQILTNCQPNSMMLLGGYWFIAYSMSFDRCNDDHLKRIYVETKKLAADPIELSLMETLILCRKGAWVAYTVNRNRSSLSVVFHLVVLQNMGWAPTTAKNWNSSQRVRSSHLAITHCNRRSGRGLENCCLVSGAFHYVALTAICKLCSTRSSTIY